MIEIGNPADTERFLPMLERHKDNYGEAPRQSSVDGGYASTDTLNRQNYLAYKDIST